MEKRHHYIPEFYIKHFANEDGLLHVYNKKAKKFNTKLNAPLGPKAVFFEWNRNTVIVTDGRQDISIEKLYSKFDNYSAEKLKEIIDDHTFYDIDTALKMIFFIDALKNHMQFRGPQFDKEFRKLDKSISFKELGVEFEIEQENDLGFDPYSILENQPHSEHYKRILLQFQVNEPNRLLSLAKNFRFIELSKGKSIIGDVPVIQFKTEPADELINQYLFPLTSSLLSLNVQNSILDGFEVPSIQFLKDLVIFDQSNHYIASQSRQYIEEVITEYENLKKKGQLKSLKNKLCSMLKQQ